MPWIERRAPTDWATNGWWALLPLRLPLGAAGVNGGLQGAVATDVGRNWKDGKARKV